MVASDLSVSAPRLKREDCDRTKHDSVFSKWQILVGPSDWEDHSLGKEGAARYRVHNLPKCSGSGVYELGIAVSRTGVGRDIGKLHPDRIVVAYLGQADNVRTRLQQYGRTGAHLGNSYYSNDSKSVPLQRRPGLFEEILSKGYPIVFRWVPMESKKDAEKIEAQLLKRFDYAWNTSINGVRRPNDILHKLDKVASNTTQFPHMVRKLLSFGQKQVGIRIKAGMLPSPENKLNICSDEESYNFLARVLKFSRSQPRLVLDSSGVIEENTRLCGVVLADGALCRKPPVERRKRCADHKGMKISGFIPTLVTEGKLENRLGLGSSNPAGRKGESHSVQNFGSDRAKCPLISVEYPATENLTPTCGIPLKDGSPCRRQPAQGRKRCDEHKGMRIHGSISESVTERISPYVHEGEDSSCRESLFCSQNPSVVCEPVKVQPQASSERFVASKGYDTICGVELGYGLYCSRQPASGRVRCEEHKGQRVNVLVSKLAEEKSHVHDRDLKFCPSDYKHVNSNVPTCGATSYDGSLCRRQPVQGNKRCWQHKGMRAGSQFSGYDSGGTFLTCGVTLPNGAICMRTPPNGRKRCEQHKGRRVTSSF